MSSSSRLFKKGEVIFTDGDVSKSIFLIRKGAISIRKRKGRGYVEVSKVTSGEVIGELSFFDHRPRSATAIAIIEVEAVEITFDSLNKVYNSIPDYMRTIMAAMAERLRRANELIISLQKEVNSNPTELTTGNSAEESSQKDAPVAKK